MQASRLSIFFSIQFATNPENSYVQSRNKKKMEINEENSKLEFKLQIYGHSNKTTIMRRRMDIESDCSVDNFLSEIKVDNIGNILEDN